MTHVTCRLTANNRDHLRNPTLGNRVWSTFLLQRNYRPSRLVLNSCILMNEPIHTGVLEFADNCSSVLFKCCEQSLKLKLFVNRHLRLMFGRRASCVTIIFGPGEHSLHSLITVLIHNSGHFGPPLPFWAPGPPALPGLPMASYATDPTTFSDCKCKHHLGNMDEFSAAGLRTRD